MKKIGFVLFIVMAVLLSTTMVAWGDGEATHVNNVPKDSHKISNKWNLSGDFVAYPGYNWGKLAEGATWIYDIHIKEAMDGQYSVGSIHFMTDGIDVVGHVEATKFNYPYWSNPNLAAVGTAVYDDATYYFMFLYAKRAVWFAISTTPYDSAWDSGSIFAPQYQLHSLNTWDFPFTPKEIH